MLLFSSLGLLKHVKPKVKVTPVAAGDLPDPNLFNLPIVDSLTVADVSFSSAYVTWRAFPSNPLSTSNVTSKLECYRITGQGSTKVFEFSQVMFEGGIVSTTIEGLPSGAEFSLRVRAEQGVGDNIFAWSEWLYLAGTFTTLSVSSNFSGFKDGIWYIDGEATTLPLSGTGEWNGEYWIQGQPTGFTYLSCIGWFGHINGLLYIESSLANGKFSCSCCGSDYAYLNNNYLNGVEVPEFFSGYGNVNDVLYQNYLPYTGPTENGYYIQGTVTPLDPTGSGTITNGNTTVLYENGTPVSGAKDNTFYIGGQPTTLTPDGTGVWNGSYYRNGVYLGAVGNPYDASQAPGTTFTPGVTYG